VLPSRDGGGLPPVRDLDTYPLLGSGRRSGAGPGLLPSTTEGRGRGLSISPLIGLCTAHGYSS
jgi:hypothetical protein